VPGRLDESAFGNWLANFPAFGRKVNVVVMRFAQMRENPGNLYASSNLYEYANSNLSTGGTAGGIIARWLRAGG
jgi:hypothetical protein